jgi:hypothetical protein
MANHRGETREERIRQFHTEHEEPVIGLRGKQLAGNS